MNNITAFIVGVARYAAGWQSTDSAARNAYVMIKLALRAGVPASQIYAFVDEEGLSPAQKRSLLKRAIVCRAPLASSIDEFWRSELPGKKKERGKLFCFWSGHGMTDASSRRLLFCRDYSLSTPNRVFNTNEFLAHLKSKSYPLDQMFFADVCGSYIDVLTVPTDSRPDIASLRDGDRTAVFASPEGAYATSKEYGEFTRMLITVSKTFKEWPTSSDFLDALDHAAKNWTQKPFWLASSGRNRQIEEHRVGKSTGFGKALSRILAPFEVAGATLKRPFHKTVQNLQVKLAVRSFTLVEIVEALATVPDGDDSGVPLAVLQFVKRLSMDGSLNEACRDVLETWLADNATNQQRSEIDALIQTEDRYVYLTVDISHDQSSGVARTAVADLLDGNGWPIEAFHQERLDVTDESRLPAWIAGLVDAALRLDEIAIPEVHIFVDPPLLYLPFHESKLEMAFDTPLSQSFNCILHFRSRAQGKAGAQIKKWKDWAAKLANHKDPLDLLKIAGPPTAFPPGEGICVTDFAHGPKTQTIEQTRQLTKLLLHGAPYICWSLEDRATSEFLLGEGLRRLLDDRIELAKLPEAIRLGCHASANDLSILWDDPVKSLFIQTSGVR
ncbi:VMAP-C domain-containing protein [Rhizobium ruizarguesonis]|uniref:VMAP-C domain-containing protein n=1 Tax=Rhizobium ruizarguesonis TaxID=2081791 RepID=UPI00103255DF|nr:hypothetical protein [Rhizobium ruizarguesonis]TBA29364.1 hypothetical protein ELH63_37090 [Rhizobium ruizarguesonis]TBA30326.1 hypothetical protein ELH62_38020 [Rhizobium ruizarguesonis]